MGKRRIGILFAALTLLLGGCGGGELSSEEPSPENISQEMVQDSGGQQTVSEEGTIAETETMAETVTEQTVTASETKSSSLYIESVESVPFEAPEEGWAEVSAQYAVLENQIYLLRTESTSEGEQRLCVQSYDGVSEQTEQYIVAPELEGHPAYTIISADITAEPLLSLKLQDAETEEDFLAKLQLTGELVETLEEIPEDYLWNGDWWSGPWIFPLAQGKAVCVQYDSHTMAYELAWYENGEIGEKLGTVESLVGGMLLDEDDTLYCLTGSDIIRWNSEKDERESLFRLHENGINISENMGLIQNGEGKLSLCKMQQDSVKLYVLTDEEPDESENLRLACVNSPVGVGYIQRCTNTFSQNGGNLRISFESVEEAEQEDYRMRILAELAAGNGPEIMWVTEDDMIMLQEKGLICDLSELIPQEQQEQLIPGIVELGTVNGEWVGFVAEANFTTMFTADSTWEKDGWTHAEFQELLNSKEWVWPVSFTGSKMAYYNLFYICFLNDMEHSEFLDLEQGISHFNSDAFVEVLEYCKECALDNTTKDSDERLRMLESGECAAQYVIMYEGLASFSKLMKMYEDNCHIVGSPSETGSGNYVDSYSYGYIVVNKQAEHKEEIGKYLAWLLDYNNQFMTGGCSVRMDVLENSVVYDSYRNTPYMRYGIDPDNPSYMAIALKEDGTTWLPEFMEFVRSCEAQPRRLEDISNILGDELSGCFEGNKNARDVANVIHQRVQLYLDEKK